MGTNLLSEIELLGDGAGIILGMDDHGEIASAQNGIRLYPNYPNPFRSYTNIKFALKEDAVIQLSILDQAGRTVAVLQEGLVEKGEHIIRYSSSGYSPGLYYFKLSSNGKSLSRKMMAAGN
ncbi:MAG: T9SS type A sorting domain-containing protein [Bacteroidales bacterium]|nr:T9SS type A sorting domain-containing protein [Bacteroidales bacterium]